MNAVLNDVKSVADFLVAHCRKGEFETVVQAMYDPQIVSVEAMLGPDGLPLTVTGLEAIAAKNKRWAETTEVHAMTVSDPLVSANEFAVVFTLDATCKQTNVRQTMEEIAVYQVRHGKIVHEQFIYDTSDCDASACG